MLCRNRSFVTAMLVLGFGALGFLPALFQADAKSPVILHFFVPERQLSVQFNSELQAIVKEFNELHQEVRIEILNRGSEFSSLSEVVAASYAGTVPHLSLIETSELEAAEQAGLLKEWPQKKISSLLSQLDTVYLQQSRSKNSHQLISLPFGRTAPLVLINQEVLFRHYIDPFMLPKSWNQLSDLIQKLSLISGQAKAKMVGLSLNGARGLWLMESLLGEEKAQSLYSLTRKEPLIDRLSQELASLQAFVDHPQTFHSRDWNRSIDAFTEGQVPLLLSFSDLLPYIASKARFRWSATPLPSLFLKEQKHSSPSSGSQLVLHQMPETQSAQEGLWQFVRFLFQSRNAIRWTLAGGFSPVAKSWKKDKHWIHAQKLKGPWVTILEDLKGNDLRPSSPALLKARSHWIEALPPLFGEDSIRKNTHKTLTLLAQKLEEDL